MSSSHWLVASTVACCIACGGESVPKAPRSPHHPKDFIEVDYPPPAGVAEIVPAAPRPDAIWVDGHWIWRGRYWVWKRGGWVEPPPGATHALWELYYGRDGRLWFAEAKWRDERGNPIDDPPFLLPAAVPPTEETAESATQP